MSKPNRTRRILAISSVVASLGGANVPATLAALRDIFNLGTLGGTDSFGYAINASGQVAGDSLTAGNAAYHAFLYTGTPGVDGRMTDLDAWLDANNPAEGAKWELNYAYGLNDGGLIAGYGTYNDGPGGLSDGTRAFILDASSLVPEPTSFTPLAAGTLGLLRSRRRGAGCPVNGPTLVTCSTSIRHGRDHEGNREHRAWPRFPVRENVRAATEVAALHFSPPQAVA